MNDLWGAVGHAVHLLVTGEDYVWEIAARSLFVSGLSTLLAAVVGIPLGSLVGLKRFPGKRLVVTLLNMGMALPPVVVGLFVYLLLSVSGPLGFLRLLYTPWAMILAQTVLAGPMIAALTVSAVMSANPAIRQTALSLGATSWQATLTLLVESRFAMGAALVAGFGAVISEVGAVMMVGGNIAHSTRVMTTAIMLETGKGDFQLAIALGLLLLLLAFVVNLGLHALQHGRQPA
jgi:ABC-type tungstate transport system substrate-binding protein